MLNNGSLHFVIDTDRFAAVQSIGLATDLSQATFSLETGNSAAHTARMHLTGSTTATYTVSSGGGAIGTLNLQAGVESVFDLPIPAGGSVATFTISR